MFFRDVNNKAFDKIESRDTFFDGLMIFVAGVVKCNIFPIIFTNERRGDNRSSRIPADIINGAIRSTSIGFGTDIKSIRMFFVDIIFFFRKEGSAPPSEMSAWMWGFHFGARPKVWRTQMKQRIQRFFLFISENMRRTTVRTEENNKLRK